MRRLALAVLLAFPASASAAPFGELPFRPVQGGATCLQATGTPGELVRWTRGGVEVLAAGAGGLTPVGTLTLGTPTDCPGVAGKADGTAVLAAPTGDGVKVVVREPGGTWGAPMTVADAEAYWVEAAINARGDAIVLWVESLDDFSARVRGVRRRAGGAFGRVETFHAGDSAIEFTAAVTGAGETFVLLTVSDDVRLTSAPAGSPFPRARRLVRGAFGGEPAIAAATDGRVLAAIATERGMTVFERAPGGDFARGTSVPESGFGGADVVLRDDGAAVVSWGLETDVGAMVRTGPGAFGPAVRFGEVRPPRPNRDRSFGGGAIVTDPGEPPYEGRSGPRATLGADGGALVAWGIEDAGVRAATVGASGQSDRQTLATPVRDQAGITPLVLADGRRAIAWTDNAPLFSVPSYAGRVHLALEGASAAPAPAPEIRIGAPRDRSLRPGQTLVLPVHCSAACDLRGTLDDNPVADPGTSLDQAGTALLRFRPSSVPIAPRRPGTIPVVVRWSAPGSGAVSSVTEQVRLRRLPAPRLPRILGLRARRLSGGRVEVRWRTDGPTIDAVWVAWGTRVAGEPKRVSDIVTSATAPAGDRRRHRVVLRDARRARHVQVTVSPRFGSRGRHASVRIS